MPQDIPVIVCIRSTIPAKGDRPSVSVSNEFAQYAVSPADSELRIYLDVDELRQQILSQQEYDDMLAGRQLRESK